MGESPRYTCHLTNRRSCTKNTHTAQQLYPIIAAYDLCALCVLGAGELQRKLERLRGLPLNPDDPQSIKVETWLSQMPSITVKASATDTWLAARQRRISHLRDGLPLYLRHQRETRQPQHKLRVKHQRQRALDHIVDIITQPPAYTRPLSPGQVRPPRLKPSEVVFFLGDAKVNTGGCVKKTMGGPGLKDFKRRAAPRCIMIMTNENNTSQTCPDCENTRFRQT